MLDLTLGPVVVRFLRELRIVQPHFWFDEFLFEALLVDKVAPVQGCHSLLHSRQGLHLVHKSSYILVAVVPRHV